MYYSQLPSSDETSVLKLMGVLQGYWSAILCIQMLLDYLNSQLNVNILEPKTNDVINACILWYHTPWRGVAAIFNTQIAII